MATIFCVKLLTDESPHFLAATDVREDASGDMEVLQGEERIAWYAQPLVQWWAYEEAEVYADPNWRHGYRTWADDLRDLRRGHAPVGMDEAGGLWYEITPRQS